MTQRRMTDEEVSRLSLSAARAELMEEIMRQDVVGNEPVRRGRSWGWVAALGAAAAVAVVATATVVLPGLGGDDSAGPATAPSAAPTAPSTGPTDEQQEPQVTLAAPGHREWAVLTTEGWVATYVSADDWREVRYEKGRQALDVSLAPAEGRDSYVEDRSLINYPERDPGTHVRVLGGEGLLWAYSKRDHTTIGAVEGERYPEVRGSGMDRSTYLGLLDDLVWVDEETFQSTLPETFVAAAGREDEVTRMLQGIDVPTEVLPITSEEVDPYQLGADVVGAVVCGWLDRYVEARAAGDGEAAAEVQYALAQSRDWPVLHEMDERGDYPEVVWEYADEVQRGEVPQGYAGGLGCAERR